MKGVRLFLVLLMASLLTEGASAQGITIPLGNDPISHAVYNVLRVPGGAYGQPGYNQGVPPGHYYCNQHGQYCNHGNYNQGNCGSGVPAGNDYNQQGQYYNHGSNYGNYNYGNYNQGNYNQGNCRKRSRGSGRGGRRHGHR